MTVRPVILCLFLLAALACTGPSDEPAGPDAAADALVADGPGPDRAQDLPADDRGTHPDLYVQPLPPVGSLSLVVNLGDSIAAGYGVTKAHSYLGLLEQNDNTAFANFTGKDLKTKFPGIVVANRAVSGSESDDLPGQAAKAPANSGGGTTLVLISIGGNDLMFNYTSLLDPAQAKALAAKVQGHLTTALATFADKSRYPGQVLVLLFNVYDFTDGKGTLPASASVNDSCGLLKLVPAFMAQKAIQNMAVYNQEMLAFIKSQKLLLGDIHGAFLGHGFNYKDTLSAHYHADDPSLWFQSDCIHPNDRGHDAIRREVWRVLFNGS